MWLHRSIKISSTKYLSHCQIKENSEIPNIVKYGKNLRALSIFIKHIFPNSTYTSNRFLQIDFGNFSTKFCNFNVLDLPSKHSVAKLKFNFFPKWKEMKRIPRYKEKHHKKNQLESSSLHFFIKAFHLPWTLMIYFRMSYKTTRTMRFARRLFDNDTLELG